MIFNTITKLSLITTLCSTIFFQPALYLFVPYTLYSFTNGNWDYVQEFIQHNQNKNNIDEIYKKLNCTNFDKTIFQNTIATPNYENYALFMTGFMIFTICLVSFLGPKKSLMIIIPILFFIQFKSTMQKISIQNNMRIHIIKCQIVKRCNIHFIQNDRKWLLFLKGLFFLEPLKYFNEIKGFLIQDKTCINLYVYLNVISNKKPSFFNVLIQSFFVF